MKKLSFLLSLTLTAVWASGESDRGLPKCDILPDGAKFEVASEGTYLGSADPIRPRALIEEFWSFVTPDTHAPIHRYITRRNDLDTTRQDFFARISRKELVLTIQLIRGDGSVVAICDLPTTVVHDGNGGVLRFEEKFTETGDTPAVHVTIRQDFILPKVETG